MVVFSVRQPIPQPRSFGFSPPHILLRNFSLFSFHFWAWNTECIQIKKKLNKIQYTSTYKNVLSIGHRQAYKEALPQHFADHHKGSENGLKNSRTQSDDISRESPYRGQPIRRHWTSGRKMFFTEDRFGHCYSVGMCRDSMNLHKSYIQMNGIPQSTPPTSKNGHNLNNCWKCGGKNY